MSPGRSGEISLSWTSSDWTDSMPSRRNSGLKPISSGSPANGAGSDSFASPTSCVWAEIFSSPSAKRNRSGELRCAITATRRTTSSSSLRGSVTTCSNCSGRSCFTFGNWPSMRRVVDVGQPRKVLGAVRVQPVARRAARDGEYTVLDAMLDLDVRIREQPRDVHEQATGYDHRAVTLDLRLERRAEGELHVRRGKTKLTRRSVQQHTGENLHRAPCRDGSGDDPEPADELLATTRDFHAGTDHYVCFHHLSKNLVVVRRGC